MKQYNPKYIFHLASKATVKMEGDEPFSMLESNILSTQKICQWAPKGAKVVLASSVIVYGDRDSSGAYTEEDITDPTSIYGMTKRASESILNYYTSTGQIEGVSARMCATVGRGLTHGVVYDFIRKLQNNPTLKALGAHPGSVKPYCHVDDLTQALLLLSMGDASGVYNIVPDDMMNIEEVAETVMASLEIYKDIEWLGEKSNWKGDNKLISVSNQKIKELGWVPKYGSKEAIVKAVKDAV
jgi:UDP-glucose 4-epimerase